MDISSFSFSVFNPRTERNLEAVNKCYELWLVVWRETIQQLDGVQHIYADDFDRQDEIYALWHGDTPVALISYRYRDMKTMHIKEDSYFRCWTAEDIRQLELAGRQLAIGSHITVHPNYRKLSQTPLPIKELIVYNSMIEVVQTKPNLDVVCGTMRNNKGMNNLVYKCGFSQLKEGVIFHNVAVDLVAFFAKRVELTVPPEYLLLIDQINNANRSKYGYSRAA